MNYTALLLGLFSLLSCATTEHGTLENPTQALLNKVERDLPVMMEYALEIQVLGGRLGRPLTPEEMEFTGKISLAHPEEIRIVETDKIVPPPAVLELNRRYGLDFEGRNPLGMALYKTVLVQKDLENKAQVIRHELVHIAQYQRLGFAGYFRKYLLELQFLGYSGVSLEAEAYERMDG